MGRDAPGGNAIALMEIDGEMPPDVLAQVRALPQVQAGETAAILEPDSVARLCQMRYYERCQTKDGIWHVRWS